LAWFATKNEFTNYMEMDEMYSKMKLSTRTRDNWWVNIVQASSGIIATLSGIYFLFFAVGGYQGGRNPWYGVNILFSRHTWDDLHTWSGIAMILAIAIHLPRHWDWFVNMTRRTVKELSGQGVFMNGRTRFNLAINTLAAISFLVVAITGIYLLFTPSGRGAVDPYILFSRTTWDLVHTWSGVIFILTAVEHVVIHWRWLVKATRRMLGLQSVPVSGQPVTQSSSLDMA